MATEATPSQSEVRELRAAAAEAARQAGRVLVDRFARERTVHLKGGIDLVTDADRASEEVLLEFLGRRFPGHSFLAEESGASGGSAALGQWRWLIDPLDGTTNYAHRVPHFAVTVAVEGPGGLLAGVILDPLRDELYEAGVTLGATLNGAPLEASDTTSLGEALLCTGFPYDVQLRPEGPVGLFARFVRQARGIRRMGSAALDLAYVASGRYDGFFEFGLKPWDIAAGVLLVQEAGGRVVAIDGGPLRLSVGDILASGPGLFETLTRECQGFLAELQR